MILRRIELKNFGCFRENAFELREGMNLVSGPNESGKSTLMEAVGAVLFGCSDPQRYMSWGTQGPCRGSLEFEDEGRSIRIERDMVENRFCLSVEGLQGEGPVRVDGKGPLAAGDDYGRMLEFLFGTAEEPLLRAVLLFGPRGLEPIDPHGIRARIRALLCGSGDKACDLVLHSLREDHSKLTRDNPWGPDADGERELERIRARMFELEQRWYQLKKIHGEVARLGDEILALEHSIDLDQEDYRKGEKYIAWVRRQWQIEDSPRPQVRPPAKGLGDNLRMEDLENKRKELQAALARTGLPSPMPEDLPVILSEAEEARKELVILQSESAVLREQLLKAGDAPWRQAFAVTGGTFLVGGTLAWWKPEMLSYGMLGAGLISALAWALYFRRAGIIRAERARIKGQAQVLERKREEAQAKLAGLDERFEAIGMSPSAVEVVRMQKNLPQARQILDQMREIDGAMGVLELAGEPAGHRSAASEEPESRPRSTPVAGIMPLEEIPEAEDKLHELGQSIKDRQERLDQMRLRVASMQSELTERQRIEEEGERLKEQELALAHRRDVLRQGHDLLVEAAESFSGNDLERFQKQVGELLQRVTAGRHGEVRFGEDFSCTLMASHGEWKPMEHFSRSTVDALWFSMRLALADHLGQGRSLPLFFDAPLFNQDKARLGETVGALGSLSENRQIIFFSHDENLVKKAHKEKWRLIALADEGLSQTFRAEPPKQENSQLRLL